MKLVCMCVVIMWDWDVCGWVCLLTDRVIESTYRENLTTLLHPNVSVPMATRSRPPPVSLPSMFLPEVHSCLPQTVTLTWGFKQCWRQHTQLLFSHDRVKCNTPDGRTVHIFGKMASTYMQCRTRSKHCSKPCWLFPQVHFMCHVFKYPWVKHTLKQACWL